ncbi:hypothetical protein TYRP_020633 [Tyrophagus putrescentiae]|nr:hypothetical protein TYRP_020633 [Tyrophagus putrescentiae]
MTIEEDCLPKTMENRVTRHSGALHELEFESSSHQLMVMNKEKEKEMKKVLNANELRLPVFLSSFVSFEFRIFSVVLS